MSPISIITCIVGIVSCLIGVFTFFSAQISKAKQDGLLLAKIDQCVNGINELKEDVKEKNHEIDKVIDDHTKAIAQMQTQIKSLFKQLDSKEGK